MKFLKAELFWIRGTASKGQRWCREPPAGLDLLSHSIMITQFSAKLRQGRNLVQLTRGVGKRKSR